MNKTKMLHMLDAAFARLNLAEGELQTLRQELGALREELIGTTPPIRKMTVPETPAARRNALPLPTPVGLRRPTILGMPKVIILPGTPETYET